MTISSGTVVKITPINAKDVTRIDVHGDRWRVLTLMRVPLIEHMYFTESVMTGYRRWWDKSQCMEVQS